MDAVTQLKWDIAVYIDELHQLTKVVKDVDEAYMAEDSEDNEMFLTETIDRYKKVVDTTRILLEALFAEEAKAGLPVDFVYRKLYAKLKQAY